MARRKIKVDQSVCIGCGTCVAVYPDDLKINDDGLAEPISGEAEEEVVETCPVQAISTED